MGSGSKKTETYTPARHIQGAGQQATRMARGYAAQAYTPYRDERVSPLHRNQQAAIDMASDSGGAALETLEGAKGRFTDADMQAYMNPFIKGALDPAARELREQGGRRLEEVRGQAASRGAFSGSRAILAEREAHELTDQSLSDLYSQGYAQAFDRGAALWQADQDRAMKIAGLESDIVDKDFQRLMSSGEVARNIEQMSRDFDYQQFVEKRDWTGKNAAYLTDVLRGLKGTYKEKRESKESGDMMGQVIGAAAMVAGAYFTGGASMAAGGSDRRLKDNLRPCGTWGPFTVYIWNWNEQARKIGIEPVGTARGLIAQEVQEIMPEAVYKLSSGYLAIDYHVVAEKLGGKYAVGA